MGKKAAKVPNKRPPGRPSGGPNTLIALRLGDKLLASLDKWAKSAGLNRSQAVAEAIRRLVG